MRDGGGERADVLRLALPSKGALADGALAVLAEAGIAVQRPSARQYRGTLGLDAPVELFFQRAGEIVSMLDAGELDVGITGRDLYEEQRRDDGPTRVLIERLGFGAARLVLAVPAAWLDVRTVAELRTLIADWGRRGMSLRVATKFPNLARAFLVRHGLEPAELIDSQGATELAPQLGVADAIVDLSASGATLREHQLAPLDDGLLLDSEACLLVNRRTLAGAREKLRALRDLLELLEGRTRARRRRVFEFTLAAADPAAAFARVAALLRLPAPPAYAPLAPAAARGPTATAGDPGSAPGRTDDGPRWRASFTAECAYPLRVVRPLRELGAHDLLVRRVEHAFADTCDAWERLGALLARAAD